jgi:hypothetical protein
MFHVKRLWLRLGEWDSYHPYATLDEVIEYFKQINLHGPLTRVNTFGFQGEQFRNENYLSLYWEDTDTQENEALSDKEFTYLNRKLGVSGVHVMSIKLLKKHTIQGNRIGWLDSTGEPSHVHRTVDGGTNTVCGHTPRNPEYESKAWKITNKIPRKKQGRSNFCSVCFSVGGKSLPWITA